MTRLEPVATYLDRILDAHRKAASLDKRDLSSLVAQASLITQEEPSHKIRPFDRALTADEDLAVIAEIKRRSPSRGDLAIDLVPGDMAKAYEAGGAAALSVLTDQEFFGGSPQDLKAARATCHLPVLRKDFTVDERDIADARIMGADAILLIVAALNDEELARFHDRAKSLGMSVLVEIHDRNELDRALRCGATLIGVNQRNLSTFDIDRTLAIRLAPEFPGGIIKVAESGVRGAEDAKHLADAGYDAVLVGESLVTSADPTMALDEMRDGFTESPNGST